MNEKAKYSTFRSTAVTNAATQVRDNPSLLLGYNIINTNAYSIYVKFYNITAASVVVGTSAVTDTVEVPPSSSVVIRGDLRGEHYDTSMSIAVTKLAADNDTTVVAALPIIKLYFD